MINPYHDDSIDEIIDILEMEYGEEIERIAKVKERDGIIHMSVIFKNYCLLEAEIKICEFCETPSIKIQGKYY